MLRQHSLDKFTGNEPLDIRNLSLLLASVHNWENLGVKMGIPILRIEEIKLQYHGDLDMCKNKLYDIWLKQNTNPSWNEVVDALEKIEENYLADKIKKLFVDSEFESEHDSPTVGHILRSSSINSSSEVAHNPSAIPLVHVTHPSAAPIVTIPVQSLGNTPPTVLSAATFIPSASVPVHHQGISPVTPMPPIPQSSGANDSQLIDLLNAMTIEDPQQIEISCKVYNVVTNKLIESTKPPTTRDIAFNRHRVQKNSVPLGTSIRLEIKANCECYMYILNIGTSGKIALLLPNECDPNFFRLNQVYYLPGPDYGFDIEGPPGKETLQIFAFSRKQDTFEKLAEQPIQEKEVHRNIVIKRKNPIAEEKKGYCQVQFDVQ